MPECRFGRLLGIDTSIRRLGHPGRLLGIHASIREHLSLKSARPNVSEAAVPTGTAEPPICLKPVALPTDIGFSGFAQYRWVELLLFGARRAPKSSN